MKKKLEKINEIRAKIQELLNELQNEIKALDDEMSQPPGPGQPPQPHG